MGKVYPEIYNYLFGEKNNIKLTERDAAINSMVLRKAVTLVKAKYSAKEGFSAGFDWRIIIEDQHDDEESPHYVLDFGEGKPNLRAENTFCNTVAYCDNYSHRKSWIESRVVDGREQHLGLEDRLIEQAPGVFRVTVVGDFEPHMREHIARVMARTYNEALEKTLPDYFITLDTSAFAEFDVIY